MSKPGEIGWFDLTVPDATVVRDFYRTVVGWESRDHDMGEYADYEMLAPGTEQAVAGICHARGPNADLPAQWLPYIGVADVDASVAACRERGGEAVRPAADMGPWGKIAIIRDPAGAACALREKAEGAES